MRGVLKAVLCAACMSAVLPGMSRARSYCEDLMQERTRLLEQIATIQAKIEVKKTYKPACANPEELSLINQSAALTGQAFKMERKIRFECAKAPVFDRGKRRSQRMASCVLTEKSKKVSALPGPASHGREVVSRG